MVFKTLYVQVITIQIWVHDNFKGGVGKDPQPRVVSFPKSLPMYTSLRVAPYSPSPRLMVR